MRNLIVNSYITEAENNKSTIEISEIKIIDKKVVGIEYFQNLQIEDMEFVNDNSQKMIELLKENISLTKENIGNYTYLSHQNSNDSEKYLDKIKIAESEIKDALIEIDTLERRINQYKRDILNIKEDTDPSLYEMDYIKIKHIIKGKIDNRIVNDTVHILFDEDMHYQEHNPWIFD
ncbi:hypothetical protein [uncultured Psychroserpens sp.]|uniref:hypothetical protein n=1 Tax=uncultured Psychroserpens sp. TaxID=255436 RepID=UPI00261B1E1A|nr:hypothetical protein [uncultured Psychroserpens sp.]